MSINIYFDMDGVLADFESSAVKFKEWRPGQNKPHKLLSKEAALAKMNFWSAVESKKDFWETISKIKEIESVLEIAKSKGNIFVLSRAPVAKAFVLGDKYVQFVEKSKKEWILQNLGDFFIPENIIIAHMPKEKLIQPKSSDLLIDDRAGNISDWVAAGGRGIIFESISQIIKDLTLI